MPYEMITVNLRGFFLEDDDTLFFIVLPTQFICNNAEGIYVDFTHP